MCELVVSVLKQTMVGSTSVVVQWEELTDHSKVYAVIATETESGKTMTFEAVDRASAVLLYAAMVDAVDAY